MKRYAYIEPMFHQLLFNQSENWLEGRENEVMWIKQKSDEEKTVKAIEKKYNIELAYKEITDNYEHKWKGYVIKEVIK